MALPHTAQMAAASPHTPKPTYACSVMYFNDMGNFNTHVTWIDGDHPELSSTVQHFVLELAKEHTDAYLYDLFSRQNAEWSCC